MGDPDHQKPTVESLLTLYRETWSEIARLRNSEWKIAYYFVSLSAGLIALIHTGDVKCLLNTHLRWVLTVVQALSGVLAIFYLEKAHQYLTRQRNIRRRIEEVLGLYDDGSHAMGAILPAEWKGVQITRWYQRLGLLVPLALMVIYVQGFTIYLSGYALHSRLPHILWLAGPPAA